MRRRIVIGVMLLGMLLAGCGPMAPELTNTSKSLNGSSLTQMTWPQSLEERAKEGGSEHSGVEKPAEGGDHGGEAKPTATP